MTQINTSKRTQIIERNEGSYPDENYFNLFLEEYTKALKYLKTFNKLLLGYFTNRIPIELIHSLGIHPIRVMSLGQNKTTQGTSTRYIQSFGCSWLREIIDIGIAKDLDYFSGIIFSGGTCDSMQNVSDIWRKIFPNQWVYNLTFPVQSTNSARIFLQNEFENLIFVLKEVFLNDDVEIALSESIKLYNSKRMYLQKLAGLVSNRSLKYSKLAEMIYLGDIIPIEYTNQYLEAEIQQIESSNVFKDNIPESPRLLVTGGMFDNFNLWKLSEFDHLVADDLSFGSRNFNFMIPQGNFLEGYTKAYLERIPDPTAMDMEKRLNYLKRLISIHKVDAVILLGVKWCDPDAFEFITIQDLLKEMDIPFLKLETTSTLSNLQQIHTRLSAFIEMLS